MVLLGPPGGLCQGHGIAQGALGGFQMGADAFVPFRAQGGPVGVRFMGLTKKPLIPQMGLIRGQGGGVDSFGFPVDDDFFRGAG